MILMSVITASAQESKYKPGFQFWMEGARTKATLIEQFRPIDEAGLKDNLKKHRVDTGNKTFDSLSEQRAIDFFSEWMWRVKLEEDYGGSIGQVTAIGQIHEVSIDLATGKAFRYKGKVIYYDSKEDLLSESARKN
jgi:hypothetical protein